MRKIKARTKCENPNRRLIQVPKKLMINQTLKDANESSSLLIEKRLLTISGKKEGNL